MVSKKELSDYSLRNPRRAATGAVAGLNYQFLRCVQIWMTLGEGQFLVCEGNEDADTLLGTEQSIESQFKALSRKVNARSEKVQQTLENFVVAFAAVITTRQKTDTSFCFLTTARLGTLRRAKRDSAARYNALTVLQTWLEGRPPTVSSLKNALLTLMGKIKEVRQALQVIAGANAYDKLTHAIYWGFGEPSEEQLRRSLVAKFDRMGVNPERLLGVAFRRVAETSAMPAINDRVLSSIDWEYLVLDEKIAMEATNWPDPRTSGAGIAYAESPEGNVCAVVVLISGADNSRKTFRRLQKREAREGRTLLLDNLASSEAGRSWLFKLDLQVFAHFDTRYRFKRPKFRELVATKSALKLTGLNPDLLDESSEDALDNSRLFADALAMTYAKAYLSTFPKGIGNPKDNSILPRSLPKLRCTYDAVEKRYYTRDSQLDLRPSR